ncbi:uncharacterized protein LOC129694725 [Leucoraja erinacea]|uniref:uncharacterized protein LOC129694725 n=1 Tax=Leucoraja erinaceus TaxID=7782 RepID=UPI002455D271|nr:uncharacterized protein LOC129694725 [Leucoraja erinacea]
MSTGIKLTLMRYYAYRIMNRDNEFNQLLRGGRLFQQYLVDMAAKMEGDRLNYIRMNQVLLRSTTYKGLTDALHDDDDLENIGRRIILSSTFVGGPRYMMGRCQDAMMYVRKYGTAAYFITMTCNPNWSEIRQCLFPNQQPSDRPELIARVFELKIKIFMKTVTGPDGFFVLQSIVRKKVGKSVECIQKLYCFHLDYGISEERPASFPLSALA